MRPRSYSLAGFRQFRVRHHDRLARLEIPLDEDRALWEDGRHEAIVRAVP